MLLSNLESVPGHQILKQLDVVYGSTVRSKHVGRDLMASLKNIVGGELTGYTELLEESRQEAMDRMIAKSPAAWCKCNCRYSFFNFKHCPRRFRAICIWHSSRGATASSTSTRPI